MNNVDISDYWKLLRSDRNEGIIGLYDALWEELYLYAAKTVKDTETAMDIVQELFISLWEKRHTLPEVQQVKAYLYAALKNRILNALAASQTREHHLKAWQDIHRPGGVAALEGLLEKELYNAALAEVNQLPQRMKEVYTLAVLEDVPVREIARYMGISEQTVRNQANLAARRVRQSIKQGLLLIIFFH
ncbi:sigma-70 family RNA polymerase sigma factor [Chitinophaga horti]|uniref:Sigma-70 family RNA polymerase sigma factor n=1 Tax=Chitinophaga horti TaxID=2920382 RepID=A0ABY6IYX5_9BACT|nr:sigma-70 family RNA polymerase sigma factor [Chitinophaga horti]UYQ91209.1 sigma-70 family RNA polymerase sigma factor [Chitinophaga horti]